MWEMSLISFSSVKERDSLVSLAASVLKADNDPPVAGEQKPDTQTSQLCLEPPASTSAVKTPQVLSEEQDERSPMVIYSCVSHTCSVTSLPPHLLPCKCFSFSLNSLEEVCRTANAHRYRRSSETLPGV